MRQGGCNRDEDLTIGFAADLIKLFPVMLKLLLQLRGDKHRFV
jgi:hypothetical protein